MKKLTKLGAIGVVGCASLLMLGAAGTARGGDDEGGRYPIRNAAYRAECGECHVAYPPRMLSARAWGTLMGKLDKHFGTDASLDQPTRREIGDFLQAGAGRRSSLDVAGREVLRISESAWFVREHRPGREGIRAGVFASDGVRSAANCEACHRAAADGDYGERSIRIPPMSKNGR